MKKKRSTYTESILQLLDLLVAGVVWNNSHRLADRLGDRLAACGKTPHKHSAPHLNESTKHKIPQEKLSVNLILSIPKALSQHTTPWLLQVAIHSFMKAFELPVIVSTVQTKTCQGYITVTVTHIYHILLYIIWQQQQRNNLKKKWYSSYWDYICPSSNYIISMEFWVSLPE